MESPSVWKKFDSTGERCSKGRGNFCDEEGLGEGEDWGEGYLCWSEVKDGLMGRARNSVPARRIRDGLGIFLYRGCCSLGPRTFREVGPVHGEMAREAADGCRAGTRGKGPRGQGWRSGQYRQNPPLIA